MYIWWFEERRGVEGQHLQPQIKPHTCVSSRTYQLFYCHCPLLVVREGESLLVVSITGQARQDSRVDLNILCISISRCCVNKVLEAGEPFVTCFQFLGRIRFLVKLSSLTFAWMSYKMGGCSMTTTVWSRSLKLVNKSRSMKLHKVRISLWVYFS